MKKNYRCGYLEFPKDKIELIRKKNEKKQNEQTSEELSGSGRIPTPHTPGLHQPSSTNSMGISSVPSNSTLMPEHLQPSQPHISQPPDQGILPEHKINAQNESVLRPNNPMHQGHELGQDFYSSKDVLRTAMFKETMFNLSNRNPDAYFLKDVNEPITSFFQPDADLEYAHHNFINTNNMDLDKDYFPKSPMQDRTLYLNDVPSDRQLIYQSNSDDLRTPGQIEAMPPKYWDRLSMNNINYSPSETNSPNANKIKYNPLPNAIHSPTTFRTTLKIGALKNTYLERYFKSYKGNLKSLVNLEFKPQYAPVWTSANSYSFWSSIYMQAVVLDVYFSFFMERSLNILLRTCLVTLTGDVFSKLATTPSVSSSSPDSILSLSSSRSSSDGSFFTKGDFDILTQKSYVYYGVLMKDLRESISAIHVEYAIKISLFAAWSTFFHLQATVDTLCLMYKGTSSLLMKVFNDANSNSEITPTTRVALEILDFHSTTSVVPDYSFDLIIDIYHEFLNFKSFLDISGEINIDHSLSYKRRKSSVHSNVFVHDCLELEKFLKELIGNYFPKIRDVNNHYKLQNNQDINDNNVHYIPTSLLFDLLVSWFKVFPSETMSIGSDASPLKKTFYLFFAAIGRSLLHMFPSVRSLMLVDPCHVICPRSDFNIQMYKVEREGLNNDEFVYLNNLSQGLLRVVKVLDYRMSLYAYHLSNTTILHHEFLTWVKPQHTDIHDYKDVIHIMPRKLYLSEVFLKKLVSSSSLNANNFPLADFFRSDNEYSALLHQEQKRQSLRQQLRPNEFNFKTGLFTHDFDPTTLIHALLAREKAKWENTPDTIEDLRLRIHSFDSGRQQLSMATQNLNSI